MLLVVDSILLAIVWEATLILAHSSYSVEVGLHKDEEWIEVRFFVIFEVGSLYSKIVS